MRLERAGIPYMLTGSIALSYYAQPRMTRDIDLVVELSGRDARSVAALFSPDYYVAEADVGRAMATQGMFNVLHLDKVVKLDLIVEPPGVIGSGDNACIRQVQIEQPLAGTFVRLAAPLLPPPGFSDLSVHIRL